jgi:putative photosynthetic complex assembly protein
MNTHAIRRSDAAPWCVAGALLAMVLVIAALGRGQLAATSPSLSEPRLRVELQFVDRTDGGVDVIRAVDGRKIAEFAPTTNGFARGVLRSMARERRLSGIGRLPPFVLLQRADGGFSLHDPETGRQVSLDGFGAVNEQVFVALLQAARSPTNAPLT